METMTNWFGTFWVLWALAVIILPWLSVWYMVSGRSRSKNIFSISFKQFVIHSSLTPAEIKDRLSGAIEPFTLFRNPFSLNSETYEGQWLVGDCFEIHRLISKNVWYVHGEIFPYPQNTTLIKVTLTTPIVWLLVPLLFFFCNPIMLGIVGGVIPAWREITQLDLSILLPLALSFCSVPGTFLVVGVAMYAFSLSRESAKARGFLEIVLAV